MNSEMIYVIGLMSGTSLDGLDIVYVHFDLSSGYKFQILAEETIKYSQDWKERLQNAITLSESEIDDLDTEYGQFLGSQVNVFIEKNGIKKVDFIASHGHTVFHEPHKGITKQIGSGDQLARITQKQVICDFRTQDVQLGGQGAPLVPIGDRILFSEFDACVNLGGFANISFEKENERIAFDICPVNVVLNHYSEQLGHSYDHNGVLSRNGEINQEVLNELNSLGYYYESYPKSLGIEWVQERIIPILSQMNSNQNILRTYVEHAAIQISNSIENSKNALFTGGGVFNGFLMERIKAYSKSEIVIPNASIINYKEALIFALLGLLRKEKKVNCLSSVTGAKQDHSSGKIFSFN